MSDTGLFNLFKFEFMARLALIRLRKHQEFLVIENVTRKLISATYSADLEIVWLFAIQNKISMLQHIKICYVNQVKALLIL